MLRKTLLNIIFAAILGVTIMLIPFSLYRTSTETFGDVKPELSKGISPVDNDEGKAAFRVQDAKSGWLNLMLTIIVGAFLAATISIAVKRKLRV